MDKDCRRHLAGERIDRVGCVWVFISMFDFRHGGSTQKLLTDKKRGSKRITGNCSFGAKHEKPSCSCENSQDFLEHEDRLIKSETGTMSVKTLIEEEMSGKNDTEYDKKTITMSDSEFSRSKEGNRKKRNKINVPIEGGKDSDDQNEMNYDCEEKFSELIKRLIAQKEGEIQNCKNLLGAFQVLGSKEESLMKTSHEPNSQRMEEEETGGASESGIERKKRRFFNRKGKSLEISSSDQNSSTSQSPRTIVILKPGSNNSAHSTVKQARNGRLVSSRFLLSFIKRILKSAVNKEPYNGPHDDASETVSELSQNCCLEEEVNANGASGRNVSDKEFDNEGILLDGSSKTDADIEDTAQTSKDSKKSTSGIYIAAKKHLSEMLANGDIDVNLPSKEVPRILGKILSLPQFSSPAASPRRTSVHGFVSHPSPLSHMSENSKIQPCGSDYYTEPLEMGSDDIVDEDSDKHNESVSANDVPIPGGENEFWTDEYSAGVSSILMEAETMTVLNPLSETCISSVVSNATGVDEDPLQWHDKDGDNKPLKQFQETFVEGQSSSADRMTECQESTTDVPGKLSPVSVLEPPFTDDDMSPKGSKSLSGEIRMQPLCIRFDEPDSPKADQLNDAKTSVNDKDSTLAYIKAVIKASGFDWEKLCLKSFHTDQLLEPDLINDIHFCSNQLCDDQKLLCDCINEVLIEFCGDEFGSGPWISFVKPTIWILSDMDDVVKVVEEEVYWHLQPLPFPHTLDQIVKKDMTRTANWMDLRFDIGCVSTETEELILDELLEETIISCLDLVLPIEANSR